MEFLLATGIGWVTACGILLLLRGRSFAVVLGLGLIGYAVNVFIFAMGRLWTGAPPILGTGASAFADPLPQALVLTAIVIGFATTGFVIELALRNRHEGGSDHVDGLSDAELRQREGIDGPSRAGAGAPGHDGGSAR
ncbi:Na+/H+ antiporter subunit C [Piscinibacter sakaiensis]|uniref:Na+/H+ antiporter subunit C n=1 Tax=Piscinibacter sakaiensis TaxID=1547922 RepID=UPI00372CF10F